MRWHAIRLTAAFAQCEPRNPSSAHPWLESRTWHCMLTHHHPGIDPRTMAKPELMTSASSVNAPIDWAITIVVHTQARSCERQSTCAQILVLVKYFVTWILCLQMHQLQNRLC